MVYSGLHIEFLGKRWSFHARNECAGGKAETFPDQASALAWLRTFKSDFSAMHSLRSIAAQQTLYRAWRFDDESILKLIAPLLSSGVFHAHRIPIPGSRARNLAAASSQSAQVFTPSRPSRSVEPARQVTPRPESPDPETFSAATDAQATAAALQQASQSGVPFCEECAGAAASRSIN